MTRRFRKMIAGLWGVLLAASPLGAQEPPPHPPSVPSVASVPSPPLPVGTIPPTPELGYQWLDEVRAQRQAREERRRAAKEARDARRRWIDPWGAAQQEAREQETQRRRDAFKEKIEREREAFRNQVPWGPQHIPWQDEPHSRLEAGTAGATDEAITPPSPYPLPGWDNRWYYRGY